jgi:hypothetical protein
VAVQIHEHHNFAFAVLFHYHFFEVVDLWVVGFEGLLPFAVEVEAGGGEAEIAPDNAVDVDHGHYFEEETVFEIERVFRIFD